MPLSVMEQALYSTVKLSCLHKDGSESSGTGFIWLIKENGRFANVVITNKHVMENVEKVHINFPVYPLDAGIGIG